MATISLASEMRLAIWIFYLKIEFVFVVLGVHSYILNVLKMLCKF